MSTRSPHPSGIARQALARALPPLGIDVVLVTQPLVRLTGAVVERLERQLRTASGTDRQ
jgi:hypothetical protein